MKDLTPISQSNVGFPVIEPVTNVSAPSAPKFRIQKFLHFLRNFWWIPLITATLGLGYAVYKFYHTQPVFVSFGRMWETEKLRLPDGAAFASDRDNYIGTMTDMLRSGRMWEQTTNYMMAFRKDQIVWGKDGNIIPVDIDVFASSKSSVYVIQARSENPGFTPAYLNALMEQYKEYRTTIRGQVSIHTENSISEQVQMYERDLKAAQAALSAFEKSNNFAVLQQESTTDGSYLVKLKEELSDYQLQMSLLDAKALEMSANPSAAETNSNDAILDTLAKGNSGAETSGRQDANKQLEMLKVERDRMAKYMRPAHPKMVKMDEDIARAQKLVDFYQKQDHDEIDAERAALKIKIDNVSTYVKEWEVKVADVNDRLSKADDYKEEVLAKQRMFDRLSALNDNVEVGRNIDQDTLDILDEATPATRSYSQAKAMLMQSIIMGLGLGLGIVFLLAFRDDRFQTIGDVTDRFGDHVVGQVPEMPGMTKDEPLALLTNNDERHIYAESYRNLRSALLYLGADGMRPRTLLITSAVPNEGKSTVVTNLARALALGNAKVLLIDADLRKGHIHELLRLQSKPGLSDLLRNGDEMEKYIQATDIPDFSFISRGSYFRNPGDLLMHPSFTQLLERCRQRYDYVLIDSGPVFASDDTTTLAPKVDGTLFVVRSQFSRARVVREALELLAQRQARVFGLILNRANLSSRNNYAYNYSEYYNSAPDVSAEKRA